MGVDRDPVQAIILVGFDDDIAKGKELAKVLEEGDNGLEFFADEGYEFEFGDRNGDWWQYGFLDNVAGYDLCFHTSPSGDPDHMIEAIEDAGFGDHIGFVVTRSVYAEIQTRAKI